MRITGIFLAAALIINGTERVSAQEKITGPNTLIYKTKKDYRELVPVILSDDKTEIVSYPDPSRLNTEEGMPLPDKLHKGYWLDNRGISKNVAFLSMTYKEYAALKQPPLLADMYTMIIDKDPLVAMCDCGKRSNYKKPVKELNRIIDKKRLKTKCKTIQL